MAGDSIARKMGVINHILLQFYDVSATASVASIAMQ